MYLYELVLSSIIQLPRIRAAFAFLLAISSVFAVCPSSAAQVALACRSYASGSTPSKPIFTSDREEIALNEDRQEVTYTSRSKTYRVPALFTPNKITWNRVTTSGLPWPVALDRTNGNLTNPETGDIYGVCKKSKVKRMF
jgi:hypothetical protein